VIDGWVKGACLTSRTPLPLPLPLGQLSQGLGSFLQAADEALDVVQDVVQDLLGDRRESLSPLVMTLNQQRSV